MCIRIYVYVIIWFSVFACLSPRSITAIGVQIRCRLNMIQRTRCVLKLFVPTLQIPGAVYDLHSTSFKAYVYTYSLSYSANMCTPLVPDISLSITCSEVVRPHNSYRQRQPNVEVVRNIFHHRSNTASSERKVSA